MDAEQVRPFLTIASHGSFLEASMAALRLLRRTMAIHCEVCLALNADRSTELVNITLTE
jgi:hypothetical protein